MPYYAWTALDITGSIYKGTGFANNVPSLENKLFSENLGLIAARQTYSIAAITLRKKDIAQAFKDIAHLLQAKIPVYQACQLISAMQKNPYLKAVLSETAQAIYQGSALDEALSWHQDVMNPTMKGLIRAGQETGMLGQTLDKIADHQLLMERLKNQLSSLLLMPIITFVAFIVLVIIFLLFIIPRFESFFSSFDKELPWMTALLITISNQVQNITLWQVVGVFGLLGLVVFWLLRHGRNILFKALLRMRLGSLIITWNLAHILQMLSVLVGGGIQLVTALSLCADTVGNKIIAKDLQDVQRSVAQGMQITEACAKSKFFAQLDLQAILSLGESTAEMSTMISQAADVYQLRAYNSIKKWVTLSQPISLMILGGLIAALLYCLYVPIFTVSHVVI